MSDQTHKVVIFEYTNWKGVTAERTVVPYHTAFESNEWHPEEQWMLVGFDLAKPGVRTFAMKDISNWRPMCP